MKIIDEYCEASRIPMYMWGADPGDKTLAQARNLANLPFAFHHVALMPDAHPGYGMPIGGVLATQGAVIPQAVGQDVGCGMCWVKTNIRAEELDPAISKEWQQSVRRSIPMGVGIAHDKPQDWDRFDRAPISIYDLGVIEKAQYQLGTLGSGNHFIELQKTAGSSDQANNGGNQVDGDGHHGDSKTEDGFICIMLHSGSRRLGYDIASYYNEKAIENCKLWHSNVPTDPKDEALAFLPQGTTAYSDYMQAMNFALDYAKENRRRMMEEAKTIFAYCVGKYMHKTFDFIKEVNIHHNFAAMENHYGKNVVVHRKGATMAQWDQLGIIPGSMGTASYIVRGKGNRESFKSCSHGAGRVMGRNEANRKLNIDEVTKAMDGIEWTPSRKKGRRNRLRERGHTGEFDLSEAPQAYKDIEDVIFAQGDLVDIVHRLEPIAVVKG